MLKTLLLALVVLVVSTCLGQTTRQAYPKTLKLKNDTIRVRFTGYDELFDVVIKKKDTVDMGTDGAAGMVATIYGYRDSIVIPYSNLPYAQIHYIPVQTPTRKVIYRFHFNNITASFPNAYMQQNMGKVQVEIPEVYELANIIWTLSPVGQRATDLQKQGAYYNRVKKHFAPYLNHPVFKQLNFNDSLYFNKYYDFRENSFTYSFDGDKLVKAGPYYYVTGNDWVGFTNLFTTLAPLVQSFAQQSNFREFYKANKAYYQQQIARQKQLMPVKNMWNWLEQQFPGRKYQFYKIVFSPLIGGSHSTQNFSGTYNKTNFGETVMFVCNTVRYDHNASLSEKQKEGLMSGVVFTEIDHNYVNRVSNRYANKIDSIFANRSYWSGKKTEWYASPVAVFNEYMTHPIFCLWVLDNYDAPTAGLVIKNREDLMVSRRQFIKFKEFDQALIALHQQNKQKLVVNLYPDILAWCKAQL